MVSSPARAALALLCVVAAIYGTALFPAAFDVELETTGADAGGGSSPVGSLLDDWLATGGGPPSDPEPDPPTPTPTPTATPAVGGEADDDDEVDPASDFDGPLAVALGLVALLMIVVVAARDAEWDAESIPPIRFVKAAGSRAEAWSIGPWLRRIPQFTTLLVVSGGAGLARVVDDLATVGRALGDVLASSAGPAGSALGTFVLTGPRLLGAVVLAPVRALASVGTLLAGLSMLPDGLGGGFLRSEPTTLDARERAAVEPAPDEGKPVRSVAEAWRAMVAMVRVPNPDATTPVEYARAAVAAGLPEPPVDRLTRLFREVRYGGRPDTEDRSTLARRALDAIRRGED